MMSLERLLPDKGSLDSKKSQNLALVYMQTIEQIIAIFARIVLIEKE